MVLLLIPLSLAAMPATDLLIVSLVLAYPEYSMVGGEDNGTPLQYSCLENPMDRGAWWAAVHGVATSRT